MHILTLSCALRFKGLNLNIDLDMKMGPIILLQQSKFSNESNGNLGLCALGRLFIPPRRKRAKKVCEKNCIKIETNSQD